MFTMHVMGGLGNQLFQIFTALAYSIQHDNKTLVFPYIEKLGAEHTGTTVRITYWDTLFRDLKQYTTFSKFSNNERNNLLNQLPTLQEPGFSYTPIPPVHDRDFRLFGYFQSYKYFESNMEQILKEKILLGPLREQVYEEHVSKYKGGDECVSISMHFRLGDYKYKQDCHPVCSLEYYQKALMFMTEDLSKDSDLLNPLLNDGLVNDKVETKDEGDSLRSLVNDKVETKDEGDSLRSLGKNVRIRVFYFCEHEDNEYVRKVRIEPLHHYFPHVEFIKVPDDIPDWKQLLFMTWCDRFILANSSFSWWGAYLGEHVSKQRKKVTYPSPWFGPQLAHNQTHDLCPPHWNKIN